MLLDGGRTVVGISSDDGRCGFATFTDDGRPDAAFGSGGVRWTETGDQRCTARTIAARPGGLLLAAALYASGDPSSAPTAAVFGIRRDGSAWGGFGTSGRILLSARTPFASQVRLTSRPDGFLVSVPEACTAQLCVAVRAFSDDGRPDASFGQGGVVADSTVAWGAFDVEADPEGRLDIGGSAEIGSTRVATVVRRSRRGDLDLTFGQAGIATPYAPRVPFGPSGGALAIDAEGRAVLMTTQNRGTTAYTFPALVRYVGRGAVAAAASPSGGAGLRIVPNPASSASTVTLRLADAAAARVVVIDALGRTVAVLADGPLPAGETALRLDAARLPAGVYAGVAQGGSVRTVRRVTVVR